MEIGKTLYVTKRSEWRTWLKRNGKTAKDIWLIYYNKASGKPRIPYNDAVEEALCFGWIDGMVKKKETDWCAQRWTPRRKGSMLSDLNRERMHKMIKAGKMTRAGMDAVAHAVDGKNVRRKYVLPEDVKKALREAGAWSNFQKFPLSYKRIRIGWIEGARSRPEVFRQRLAYFVRMTAKNKKFGMVQ